MASDASLILMDYGHPENRENLLHLGQPYFGIRNWAWS